MKGKNDRRFRSSPAVLLSLANGDVGGLCKRVRRLREWVPAGSDYGNVWRIEDQIFRESHNVPQQIGSSRAFERDLTPRISGQ